MTGNQVLEAYMAIMELSKCVLPYKAARGVAGLKRALQVEYETLRDAEGSVAEKHGGTFTGGQWVFPDSERKNEFDMEMAGFMEEDVDIDLPKVDISKYSDQLRLSPNTIFSLDGIVVFEKEG